MKPWYVYSEEYWILFTLLMLRPFFSFPVPVASLAILWRRFRVDFPALRSIVVAWTRADSLFASAPGNSRFERTSLHSSRRHSPPFDYSIINSIRLSFCATDPSSGEQSIEWKTPATATTLQPLDISSLTPVRQLQCAPFKASSASTTVLCKLPRAELC